MVFYYSKKKIVSIPCRDWGNFKNPFSFPSGNTTLHISIYSFNSPKKDQEQSFPHSCRNSLRNTDQQPPLSKGMFLASLLCSRLLQAGYYSFGIYKGEKAFRTSNQRMIRTSLIGRLHPQNNHSVVYLSWTP